ncbi:hypothetical protein Gorai_016754 [Gossypium raimondii]|uniref:Protein kinase domain-containing protein n=1 Tax=Gossypium raimondii TaxID=29730 RepID=A0A7J8P9Q7_GOSRA|nr:hypothetical protein [Gossypium raimondii]
MGVSLTYEAIVQAIGNFSAGKCMGNNGFGSTYKTEIALGSLVAVKRLTIGRFQGVTTVSCRGAVNWKIVHKIALDVAHALAYLHEQCTPKGQAKDVLTTRLWETGPHDHLVQLLHLAITWPLN